MFKCLIGLNLTFLNKNCQGRHALVYDINTTDNLGMGQSQRGKCFNWPRNIRQYMGGGGEDRIVEGSDGGTKVAREARIGADQQDQGGMV